jgi:hypothetical protein
MEPKRIKIDEIPNYYMDDTGKLCYQKKDGKWMYCKRVDNKPGWVWVYAKGVKGEWNQTQLASKYIKGFKERKLQKDIRKEVKVLGKLDGRYKAGTDTGIMSKSKVLLPLKPIGSVDSGDKLKEIIARKKEEKLNKVIKGLNKVYKK